MKKRKQTWAYDAEDRLNRTGFTKKQLAKMLQINYQQLCNIFNGNYLNERQKSQILAQIAELEQEARRAV